MGDLEVEMMEEIHQTHLDGNSLACMIKERLSQSMESKALAKSSFKASVGVWHLWQHYTSSMSTTKFSEMDLPLMKRVWSMSMRAEIFC
jgi:hypothetical protein